MNATCERFLGSVRRECLDHIIILWSVLDEYVTYFKRVAALSRTPADGPSCSLRRNVGSSRQRRRLPDGLHHDYRRAA